MNDLNIYGMFKPVDIQVSIYNFSNPNWMMPLFDRIAMHTQTHREQQSLLCVVHSDRYVLTDSEHFITKLEYALDVYDIDWRIREWHFLKLESTHSSKSIKVPLLGKTVQVRASNIFGMWLHLTKFGIEDI